MDNLDFLLESQLSCRGHGEYLDTPPFALPGDSAKYPRDRVVDMKHVRLDFSLDLDAKRIEGRVAHTFAPLNEGVMSIDLDAVELDVSDVRISDGDALQYSLSDGRLHIEFPEPLAPGADVTIAVDFAGSPRRGLYFISPSDEYPDKRKEAWTQGEDEDTRHWFPCY